MGSGPGETPQVGSPRSVVEEPTLVKAKDAAVHPVEPSAEPEGGPSASGRPLPKPADHHHHHRRRFGHAKPVQATLADAPEEHLPGSPTPKSHVPRGDSFFVADFGSVGRPSPRSKRGSRKGDGPALEAVEASKELPPESWDPEASAALKKKKKKGKPKKGPPPRGTDPWEDPFRSPPAPDLLLEASKEVSWASGEVPRKPSLKFGLGGRQPDGLGRPSFPPVEIEEPSKFPSEPKPGERSQAKARTDDGSAWQPESPKGELSEDQKKQPRSSSSPLPPPPPGAEEVRPAEKSVELASRTPPKASNVDGSAWETSSAAGQKVEIQTVDLLVAPDKVPPEFQGLGRKEEPAEKAKELEEVFKKESEAKRDLHLPADSNATVPTQEGTPLHQGAEDNSGVSGITEESPRSQQSGFHSAQAPLVVEPTSDPAQPLFVGGGPVSFTGPTEELLGLPVPELPTALKLGHDQPKKRDSDGKSKKAKPIPEVKEEKIGWSKASAVVDLEGLGEIGWTTRNPEQTLSTSPGAREKPKKRSSVGKSRKSEERSSFRQPFFTTMEDHLASRQMFDPTQRRGEKEGADITVADGLKQTSPPFVPSGENIQGSPDGVDTLPSAFPFISEAPEKQTERRVLLESTVPGPDRNKGPPWASPPGGGEDLSFGWATGKTKKRSSDGRSKTSRRGPSAGPSLKPEKTSDERDGLVSSKKGDFVQEGPPKSQGLELPGAAQLFPVLLETTGGKEGENVGLEELSTAGEKASPAKAEDLHETKETPPKGQEAHQDGGGEGPSKPHILLPQVLEEVKKPEGDLQDLQVPKVSEMKAEPSSQRHRGVKIEEVPTSDGAKEETSEDLLKPPGQLPAELLVEEIFGGQKKGKSGPDLPTLEQSVPFLDTSETGRVLEAESKVKTKASRASREKKDGVSDLYGPQPLKKSTEKKSKKTSIVPPEETKEDVCREDPRRGGGSDFTPGEAEVVDENRNIQSFPPGRQLRWEEDLTNVFDPAGALEEANAQTQGPTCPFLQHSSKLADEGPFCLPQFLQDAKLGDQKIPEELQENLAKLEGRDVEASLVMKAGVDVREKRKKNKRTTEGRDSVAETHHGSRLAEESRGAEFGDPREGLGSPEMVEEKPKMAPGLAAEGGGGLAGGDEVPTETQALKGSEKEASTLPTATAVLGGGSSPPGTVAEDGGEAEPRPPDSSGSRWRTDNVPAEEVGNLLSADDKGGPEMVPLLRPTDGEGEEKKTGQLGETSQLPDGPSLRAEGGEPPASTSPAVADHAERGPPAEVKKESPARPPPPMKGYMRPTKSRGLPLPRDAALERGRRRPGKAADGPLLPSRRDTGEVKASAELPSSDEPATLPPSPEKKTKPSATAGAKPAAPAKSKPGTAGAPPAKRPASATLGPNKKTAAPGTAGPATSAPAPKRPSSGLARPSSLTPRELKPKGTDGKIPEKKISPSKPPSAPRPGGKTATPGGSRPATSPSPRSATAAGALASKKPSAVKTDVKAADAKKASAKSPTAEPSRPRSAPASTTASPAPLGASAGRPKPKAVATKPLGSASVPAEPKKPSLLASKALPKTSPGASKPPRPTSSVSVPDLKNIRSKIGSTDNIKHQPGGGKVLILSKRVNYSHVQSKCGSKDNIKHIPGGGNVQILNKKIDLSKVAAKCGSKANLKHKPGGGDVKIENQKLNFKEKAQAKVGSLDNVGHVPAGGTVKTEGDKEAAPENGGPPPGSIAPQENGAGPLAPAQGGGDQREIQSFNTHIQETN